MFRDRVIFLFVISAILIPLVFITRELILLGIFIVLFILAQIIFIYLFYREKEMGLEQWYVFWSAIASLVFMLVLVLSGRRAFIEFLGLILFLTYFIGLIIFLFRKQIVSVFKKQAKQRFTVPLKKVSMKPKKKPVEEENFESFRKKDELQQLVDFFEPGTKPKQKVVSIKEPRIDKVIIEKVEEEEKKKQKERKEKKEEKLVEKEEDWLKNLPKSIIFDYEEKKPEIKPRIRELKKAPKIDFEKVKQDLKKIDTGVKTISEKIRLISERAIQEGKKKRKREEREKKKAKQKKPKKSEMRVYASKTGNKYHYDKNCLGLRRVSKKNLITYTNSAEARRKGLKACGICK